MDHYQEPVVSDNHYDQMPVIQQPQQSQSIMRYDSENPHESPSAHDEIIQTYKSPQTPVHDAMSSLQLENQIPSTSGSIVESPVRMTRARTRGMISINNLNILCYCILCYRSSVSSSKVYNITITTSRKKT